MATLPSPLDLPDGSVGVIRAHDFLEHVVDKVALINELYRVLAPGGMLLTLTPSTDGRGAFQDPTHVAYYNENSFWYYTEQQHRAFVPTITARFQSSRLHVLSDRVAPGAQHPLRTSQSHRHQGRCAAQRRGAAGLRSEV